MPTLSPQSLYIHSERIFNNGAVDLKDIAEYFEHIFEIDLGQYRRAFLEIRVCKAERNQIHTALNEAFYTGKKHQFLSQYSFIMEKNA